MDLLGVVLFPTAGALEHHIQASLCWTASFAYYGNGLIIIQIKDINCSIVYQLLYVCSWQLTTKCWRRNREEPVGFFLLFKKLNWCQRFLLLEEEMLLMRTETGMSSYHFVYKYVDYLHSID